MELDIDALQRLEENEPEVALWPCTVTCRISCDISTI
ncbi:ALQxL family class IV lanthipeptide [Krasilnikovia sp. MM14-A1259]